MILSKKFICYKNEYNEFDNHVSAPVFRRTFTVDEKVNDAELSVCGLGYYRLFVNSKEITRGLLSSYTSNPNEVLYYDVYNVKK
jgi:alpha-L-rhamnosidase